MVSFQTLFPKLNQKKMIIDQDHDDESEMISNSKKRKWDDFEAEVDHESSKNSKAAPTTKSLIFDDIELHLETPLPSEWQRCLDIQSGEIHFYNTRTHKRTVKDPRREGSPVLEGSSSQDSHMSLELELNLPCHGSYNNNNSSSPTSDKTTNPIASKTTKKPPSDLLMSLSSVAEQTSYNFEEADKEVEMVATACMKCHMLVMLCKSSPTCPNCKFVHPPYQTAPDLFKPRLSLYC